MAKKIISKKEARKIFFAKSGKKKEVNHEKLQKSLDNINLNIEPQSGMAKEFDRKEAADKMVQILIDGVIQPKKKMKWRKTEK